MPVRSLRDGQVRIADAGGTGGANVITVAVEDGDLNFTESHPINVIHDRGVLDHARLANEVPLDLSFSIKFQEFQRSATIWPWEALTQSSGASAWVSDEPNSDVYAVIIEFTMTDPAGGASEVLTFARYAAEQIQFSEGDPNNTMSVSGRCMITAPAIA